MLTPYWVEVISSIEYVLGLPIPTLPQLCLFRDQSVNPPGLPKKLFGLVVAGFMAAARLFLRK